MLRNYVGDSAFFKSLNLYLRTKKFNSAEAHDLRLAFEDVTGQDLNWFWNQWYFGSGHPKLDINYIYDPSGKYSQSNYKANSDRERSLSCLYQLMYIRVRRKNGIKYGLDHQADTFVFQTVSKPDLINVDGDKILLCEKTDHKTS